MSKIRLHGSSSGYMEIAPPAAGSSATVTLPNSAGEILLSDGSAASLTQIPAANIVGVCTSGLTKTGGFGNLVNYSHTLKTDTFSQSLGQSVISNDVISVSHTASSTNNKLFISYSLTCGSDLNGLMIFSYLYADGSPSTVRGDASGSQVRATTGAVSEQYHAYNQNFQAIIQAASTNATTYSVRLGQANNGTNVVYLNHSYDSTDANYIARTASSIQVLELEPNT